MSDEEVVPATFDYGELGESDRVLLITLTASIKMSMRKTFYEIVFIGKKLIEAKGVLEHGRFLAWVKTEFEMSHQTAYNFMRLAEKEEKLKTVLNFPLKILYELSAPSTPDCVIDGVADGTIPPRIDAIKEAKEAQRRAEEQTRLAQQELFASQQEVASPTTPHIEIKEVPVIPPETEERRRIPVDHITYDGWSKFEIHFHENTVKTHRKEFAALRRALREYAQAHHTGRFCTVGVCWNLHPDLIHHFADWLEFPGPIEELMEQARQEEKERAEREKQEELERQWQRHRERCAYRIPCTNSRKVRLFSLQCIGGEVPFDDVEGLFGKSSRGPVRHRFHIVLDEGKTSEEKDAWRYFAKVLEVDKQNRATGPSYRLNNIEGNERSWNLHEYVLYAYADWLEFDGSLEDLISQAVERKKREDAEWDAYTKTGWRWNRTGPGSTIPSELEISLATFNLDKKATREEVKKRYKLLAKIYHPDTGGREEEFKRLNKANQVLMQHFV